MQRRTNHEVAASLAEQELPVAKEVHDTLDVAAHDLEDLLIARSDFEAHLVLSEFAAHGGRVVGA